MSESTSEPQSPSLANAQVTGGGGHEPDLEQSGPDGGPARTPAAGAGVDLKTNDLPQNGDG